MSYSSSLCADLSDEIPPGSPSDLQNRIDHVASTTRDVMMLINVLALARRRGFNLAMLQAEIAYLQHINRDPNDRVVVTTPDDTPMFVGTEDQAQHFIDIHAEEIESGELDLRMKIVDLERSNIVQ